MKQESSLLSTCLLFLLSLNLSAGGNRDGMKQRKKGEPIRPYNPEISMTSVEIIISRGYPVEIHPVRTEDGFVLMLHRIPHGKGQSASPAGKPVYIQHGIMGSSAEWIILPSNQSLAFQLADLGYDVWLGNARGNRYSANHVWLDPWKDATFWDFSFDEMGKYDVPAVINHILSTTKREKLVYIGYSMGTTMFWVAMDYHPELNDKIESMIALAPVSSLANVRSPVVRVFAPFYRQIQFILRLFQGRVFLSQEAPIVQFQRRFCASDYRITAIVCENIVFLIVGADYTNTDVEVFPTLNGHIPAGASVQTFAHFAQLTFGEKFVKYDYGWLGNLINYNQLRPPSYDLSKVTAPVYLLHGQNDLLSTIKDVDLLAKRLPNVKQSILIDSPEFNHADFFSAKDINHLLYDGLFELLPAPY